MIELPDTVPEGQMLDHVAAAAVVHLKTGAATEEDLAVLRAWLEADPAHRAAFARARTAWLNAANVVALSKRGKAVPVRSRFFRPALVAGTALAACLALFVLAMPASGDLQTTSGEVRRIELPDGTIAWLDGDTALNLRYAPGLRRVELLRGQAAFAVRHDTKRSFEVAALGATARDVGTEFIVRRDRDNAVLTVLAGVIQVSLNGQTRTLAKGKATRWGENVPLQAAVPADAHAAQSWRDGTLIFDHTSLRDAIAELQRHRRDRIWLLDGALGDHPVSGVIFKDHLEEGLDAVAASAGFELVRLPFATLIRHQTLARTAVPKPTP